jgi:hypothetical protein
MYWLFNSAVRQYIQSLRRFFFIPKLPFIGVFVQGCNQMGYEQGRVFHTEQKFSSLVSPLWYDFSRRIFTQGKKT